MTGNTVTPEEALDMILHAAMEPGRDDREHAPSPAATATRGTGRDGARSR